MREMLAGRVEEEGGPLRGWYGGVGLSVGWGGVRRMGYRLVWVDGESL